MRRIIEFIIFAIGFFVFSHAAEINECKTDIYYGNGVWNSSGEAKISQKVLEKFVIGKEIIKGNPTLQAKYGEVKLQYNWSYGKMLDVLETYYQLKEAGQVNDLEFFAVITILTRGNMVLSARATMALRSQMPFAAQTEQLDVDKMLQKYRFESFRYSHRVLLVSHSQGNLFANRVYDNINPSGYKDYFANVQVATPASSVHAANGTYVTGLVDPVINPIPGSLGYNGVLALPGGHAFVEAYLDSADTYDRIVTGIKAQLDNLNKTDSQWSTDQKYDKNTCDYKITVKHRFDQSMEMAEKVYPFNTTKKLYSVNGEYVKASCGGKNILQAWEDKKRNECWMIDNPQKEKINKRLYRTVFTIQSDFGVGGTCNWSSPYSAAVFSINTLPFVHGYILGEGSFYKDEEPHEIVSFGGDQSSCPGSLHRIVTSLNIKYKNLARKEILKPLEILKKKYGEENVEVTDQGDAIDNCFSYDYHNLGYGCNFTSYINGYIYYSTHLY